MDESLPIVQPGKVYKEAILPKSCTWKLYKPFHHKLELWSSRLRSVPPPVLDQFWVLFIF